MSRINPGLSQIRNPSRIAEWYRYSTNCKTVVICQSTVE
jgi:hypothetical protein